MANAPNATTIFRTGTTLKNIKDAIKIFFRDLSIFLFLIVKFQSSYIAIHTNARNKRRINAATDRNPIKNIGKNLIKSIRYLILLSGLPLVSAKNRIEYTLSKVYTLFVLRALLTLL